MAICVSANGAFSYGEGTTLNASNLTVTTKSGSSAPIRSDRGGGQLKDGSSFEGSIASEGKCYVELDSDSTWTLTADTEIDALTCEEDSIKLNGYVLKVDGKVYEEGIKSKGDAIEITVPASSGMDQMPPGEGNMEPPKDGKEPPEKPEGMNDGKEPPEKPEGMKN